MKTTGKRPKPSHAKSIAGHWRDSVFWQDIFVRNAILPLLFPRNTGISVLKERWDNLIILDACRFDTFEKMAPRLSGAGRLESRISLASDTRGFLLGNFPRQRYDDIVYVASNPQVSRFMRGRFHAVIPVWMTGWDEAQSTVLPSTVVEYAKRAANRYPGKRLIIHFMQPHHPYLGFRPSFETMRKVEKRPMDVFSPWPKSHDWYTFFITHEPGDLLRLYETNLSQVLDRVADLVPELSGTTVITADHGEAFGEYLHPLIPMRVFEHPPNVRIRPLVKVPWYVLEPKVPGAEPTDATNPPEDYGAPDEELVMRRLKALGYE